MSLTPENCQEMLESGELTMDGSPMTQEKENLLLNSPNIANIANQYDVNDIQWLLNSQSQIPMPKYIKTEHENQIEGIQPTFTGLSAKGVFDEIYNSPGASSSRTGSMQANAIQSITYQMILDGRCGDRGESDYRMSPLISCCPKFHRARM